MHWKQTTAYRWAYNAFHLYYDGFRSMTIGKTLWLVILIKLFVIFVILKVFFFPNFLKEKAPKGEEAAYVSSQVTGRLNH
jgi:hypothetical protein